MATMAFFRRPATTTIHTSKRFTLTQLTMSRAQSTLRSYLVTPNELAAALRANSPSKLSTSPKTVPICGSWFLPNDPEKRAGQQVFKAGHIPSARFFDLDKVADTSSPYPHMLPSPEVFRDALSELGVKRDDTLVVYDSAELGIFSAPRVAWTLRVFGHPSVHLLNNYKLWVAQGHEVEAGEQAPVERTEYPLPQLDASKVVDFKEVRELALDYNKEGHEEVQILDARSEGRWKGVDPEPRPGLSSGHIPGSQPVPVPDLLDPQTKTFLSPEKLREVFKKRGVDPEKPIIASCGTGVTATIIDAALTEAGYGDGVRRVYDGSWTEWAQRVKPAENLIHKSE
jgi:thiosulfate/3-mercaptopyruvate sulfurtransferase